MIQGIRNKQTLSILNKMKEKGPPAQGEVGDVSLDMTLPEPEEDQAEGDDQLLQPVQGGTRKKKPIMQGPSGI